VDAASVLVIPGLHFLGVEDPRFARFVSILRTTGARVEGLDLPELRALTLPPSMLETASAALERHHRAHGPVALMSISFGSIVALTLAARHPDKVSRLVLFGGYHDLQTAFCFALGGAIPGFPAELRDPLNAPAVFLNLVDELLPASDRPAFARAARTFCERTWSRGPGQGEHGDDKRDGRHLRVGAELAETLDGPARDLFRTACRLDARDPLPIAMDALARAGSRFAFLDPGPLLTQVRCPVTCVHGRDDDVIPFTESEALARALPHGEALITGLYGHTGNRHPGPGKLARELVTMVRVLDALARLTG
jgi:pimeloyl-ACP methyl ester carboxylesterase